MNENFPLISIIVPVYNVEAYLNDCVDSLVNQKYSHIEIILVNDGSTDNTASICEQITKSNKNVFYYLKENGGASSARNLGLTKAKGDYIAFIDSDDIVSPDMFLNLYFLLRKHKSDVVACNFAKFTSDKKEPYKPLLKLKKVETDFSSSTDILKHFFLGVLDKSPCNKLYTRKALNGIQFKEGVMAEDQIFLFDLYNKINKITYLNKVYYYYRYNPSSVSNSYKHKISTGNFKFQGYKNCFYLEKKIPVNSPLMKYFEIYKIKMCITYAFLLAQTNLSNLYPGINKEMYELCKRHFFKVLFNRYFSINEKLKNIIILLRNK